jgi:hypothetical protein
MVGDIFVFSLLLVFCVLVDPVVSVVVLEHPADVHLALRGHYLRLHDFFVGLLEDLDVRKGLGFNYFVRFQVALMEATGLVQVVDRLRMGLLFCWRLDKRADPPG